MGALFQSTKMIIRVIYLVGIRCVLSQSNDRSIERSTSNQGPSYFFYQQSEYPKDCHDVLNQCTSSNSSGVHLIKPTGYGDPFEVHCKNEPNFLGWTVIQRRLDGSISFNRNWNDFKNGFGFLLSEFWLGNDKLSYLTNQGVYELRIDVKLSNGSSLYVSYNSFRISDEWSQYAIVHLGSYHGDADIAVIDVDCPLNMIHLTCTCQPTCSSPSCISSCEETEHCICATGFLKKGDECVPLNECECFVAEINKVVPNGESYVNLDCSAKYTCQEDRLSSDSNYRCSPHAQCRVKHGVRQCYCNEGYEGDGETCRPTLMYTDCYDAYEAGHREDGVYTILPSGWQHSPFNVTCVMSTNGGGWTVFQRRTDGVSDFYQNWNSYRYGFGSFEGDFWLGNEQLHYLTNQKHYKLRIDIVTPGGSPKYEEYSWFRIGDNSTKFRMKNIGSHSGTAGDGMYDSIGSSFSTYDEDNDECGNHDCVQRHRSAWWHANNRCSSCYLPYCSKFQYSSRCSTGCTYSNLNGDYDGDNGENIFWYDSNNCNPSFAEMKIRPL